MSFSAYRSYLEPVSTGSPRIRRRGLDVLARITLAFNPRDVRRRNFPFKQSLPDDLSKPWMRENILAAILQIPIPLRDVVGQEPLEERDGHGIEKVGVDNVPGNDLFVQMHGVRRLCVKRRVAREHFKHEHAKRVPVDRFVVRLSLDDLWRQVVWCATQRPGDVGDEFGESKICELDVAIRVDEDVFRLKIAIDDVVRVEIVNGKRNLCRVEFRDGVGEPLRFT
jgi:hypothetical protein